jgi:hypothetical protein
MGRPSPSQPEVRGKAPSLNFGEQTTIVSQVNGNCKAFLSPPPGPTWACGSGLNSYKVVDLAMKVYPDGCNVDEAAAYQVVLRLRTPGG